MKPLIVKGIVTRGERHLSGINLFPSDGALLQALKSLNERLSESMELCFLFRNLLTRENTQLEAVHCAKYSPVTTAALSLPTKECLNISSVKMP